MSKSNIFNIIAILVIFGLLFFIFRGDEVDTSEYDAKIDALEKKVDSLHQKNTFLEKEADSLEFAIEQSDKKIKQLNTRIYVIKRETEEKLMAIDTFGSSELQKFFAERYNQSKDSIN